MTARRTSESHRCSIEGLAFAAALPRRAQRRLEGLLKVLETQRNGIVAREGEVGGDFLILAEGCLKLWKALPDGRRQIVAFRGQGDVVSLHRCHKPWPVTAQAITASTIYSMEWDAL